jgi:ABC-2 type transport system permease protein
VLLEGTFRSAWRNRLSPDFKATEAMGFRNESGDNKMIVIADGDIVRNRYIAAEGAVLPMGYDFYTQTQYANKELLLNAVNYLVGDEGLMASRSRNIKLRKLDVMKVKEERTKYQIINVALPVALLVIGGGVIAIVRRKKYRK